MKIVRHNNAGFTLIELLLAMVIGLIVMTQIYSVYNLQQKVYASQLQIVEMQQNLRAGMLMLTNELRMAGYDPTGNANAGFVSIAAGTINFTLDDTDATSAAEDGDGTINGENENITYSLAIDPDDGRKKLFRQSLTETAPGSAVAENIDALEFIYLDADGSELDITDSDSAALVTSVEVSLVARTDRITQSDLVNNTVYRNLRGDPINDDAYGDAYRRRVLSTRVKCRNLGL